MPELPEVDTIRRRLAESLPGRRITAAWSHPSPKFAEAPAAIGTTIESVDRRGKYLLLPLDDGRELIMHLGMTGSLRLRHDETTTDPYDRARWTLHGGGSLAFRDVRRFGRIAVTDRGDHGRLPTLAALGPEPFGDDLDGDSLWRALRASRQHLKTQLLSQRPVAGVGNIYADEAFWIAGVNPADRAITRARAHLLLDGIRTALRSGLDHGGTTLRDYVDADGGTGSNQHHLHCYGRADEPCERCGDLLRRTVLDGRSTTWCRVCQPRRA
jgi:formamidopyrimidine-DNA glycosylase